MILRLCHYEGFSKCNGSQLGETKALAPHISPSANPEPFLPVLGPSPVMPLKPLTNGSIPPLSGMFYNLHPCLVQNQVFVIAYHKLHHEFLACGV